MHKVRFTKTGYCAALYAAMAVLWALPALAVSESDVESALASQGKEAVSGNLFVCFLCAIAFLKVSTKIDSILQAMGLGVGRAPGSILAEAFMALRGMQAGKAVLSARYRAQAAVVLRPVLVQIRPFTAGWPAWSAPSWRPTPPLP